jgi:hypothetical protein
VEEVLAAGTLKEVIFRPREMTAAFTLEPQSAIIDLVQHFEVAAFHAVRAANRARHDESRDNAAIVVRKHRLRNYSEFTVVLHWPG